MLCLMVSMRVIKMLRCQSTLFSLIFAGSYTKFTIFVILKNSRTLPPFSLIRDFGKQNTCRNVSKISVNHSCYRQIGLKSTNHNHLCVLQTFFTSCQRAVIAIGYRSKNQNHWYQAFKSHHDFKHFHMLWHFASYSVFFNCQLNTPKSENLLFLLSLHFCAYILKYNIRIKKEKKDTNITI